jgi:hypothetical protein
MPRSLIHATPNGGKARLCDETTVSTELEKASRAGVDSGVFEGEVFMTPTQTPQQPVTLDQALDAVESLTDEQPETLLEILKNVVLNADVRNSRRVSQKREPLINEGNSSEEHRRRSSEKPCPNENARLFSCLHTSVAESSTQKPRVANRHLARTRATL